MAPAGLVRRADQVKTAVNAARQAKAEGKAPAEQKAAAKEAAKLSTPSQACKLAAEHGRPRTDRDYDRAYEKACVFELVDPGDWPAVQELIACSSGKAKELTRAVREARESEQRRRMVELWQQGEKQEAIAEELKIDRSTVGKTLRALGFDTDRRGRRENGQVGQIPVAAVQPSEPEQLDIEGAIAGRSVVVADEDPPEDTAPPGPGHDPVAEYEAERERVSAQRAMWAEVRRWLEAGAKLAEPATLPLAVDDVPIDSIPAVIDDIERQLAEARTLPEVTAIRDKAEALRVYARRRGAAIEAQNGCARLVFLAERQIGAELAKGQEVGEVAKRGRPVNPRKAGNWSRRLPSMS